MGIIRDYPRRMSYHVLYTNVASHIDDKIHDTICTD
jgi:hypothetical protein